MVLAGEDVMGEPLAKRRDLLEKKVLPRLAEPIRYSPAPQASLADLIQSVKAQGFEGLVAKRQDSKYPPGLRTGAWQTMRVNQG
jgi:bifunctional non-homologous end joining protein LigD